MKTLLAIVAVFVLAAFALAQTAPAPATQAAALPDGLYSKITTPAGVVICELYYKKTPLTVASFVGLAEGTLGPRKGTPFYDGLTWHRVVADFVVQGGQGPRIGYSFPDECVPGLRHDSIGVLEMANSGPDSNGSQIVLMLNPSQQLNYNHTVFGHTVQGVEILPKIKQGDAITKIEILRIGDDAKAFKADQQAFDALLAKAKKYDGPKNAGPDAFFDDPDTLLPTTIARARDFNSKLANFQRFTGQRIISRVFAKTPDDAQGDKLDAYMTALATKMKVDQTGALLVFFADANQWHIRLGKDSVASFIAGPRKADGTKDPLAKDKTLEQATADFFAVLNPRNLPGQPATAPASGAATQQARPNANRLTTQLFNLFDELIFRLEPAPAQ